MLSDALVVLGLLTLASLFIAPPLLSALGNKKALVPSEVGWLWTLLYWVVMLTIWSGYFILLWSRSGQTVGMRAWRVRVVTVNGQAVTPVYAAWRFFLAALPWLPAFLLLAVADMRHSSLLKWLGMTCLLWGGWNSVSMLWRPSRQTWHDLITEQRVILLPKL